MKILPLIIAFLISLLIVPNDSSSRTGRYLIYSKNGSKLQLIFGTGLPIPLEHISATIGWIIKYTMPVPTNATDYTDPLHIVNERKRSITSFTSSRYELYRHFERKLLRFHSAGRECLLKAICEVAQVPFKGSSLIGKLWMLFLMPSATNDTPMTDDDYQYHIAEDLGRQKMTNCASYFSPCDFNFMDLLTVTF